MAYGSRAADVVARINGRARGVLAAAERTALNLQSCMSGVTTATRALADAVAGTNAKIVCTRKTTPGPAHARKAGGAFDLAERANRPP
jgi:nicotinate-nucleotide pyrophosphorylase (carboxylating)